MSRIGLALSGGGFRATIYHLGVVKLLRDAGLLGSVSHVSSVSGGSILAAHLVQNWDLYTGTNAEFQAAAHQILRFVQLDVRNRIVRRYPFQIPLRSLSWLLRHPPGRRLTRTGLLEAFYRDHLYGDVRLADLPPAPHLFLLTTNVSEGCLCAFTREGMLRQRRGPDSNFQFERCRLGLATIPMAVTASSAFPGFFPPVELDAQDVGAPFSDFPASSFTDGGVFDNLGVRMYRFLERSALASEINLRPADLIAPDALEATLEQARSQPGASPLQHLANLVAAARQNRLERLAEPPGTRTPPVASILDDLWTVVTRAHLALDPVFEHLDLVDLDAVSLLRQARAESRSMEPGDRIWLNRRLVDSAFLEATGQPCFKPGQGGFDAVLVSDAGKPFKVLEHGDVAGLIRTSLRSTDIVMDRVWQLETERFSEDPEFVFARITRLVESAQDPHALDPEIQRQTASIRTDLDHFNRQEITCLAQQGYCVARAVCRERADLFNDVNLPGGPPWDPFASQIRHHVTFPPDAAPPATTPAPDRPLASMPAIPSAPALPRPAAPPPAGSPSAPAAAAAATRPWPFQTGGQTRVAPALALARQLQFSSRRRVWSRLFDYKDWVSYLYIPLIALILWIPFSIARLRHESAMAQRLIESMAQSSDDFHVMRKLLLEGSNHDWQGVPIEKKAQLRHTSLANFQILADTRYLDLRELRRDPSGKPAQGAWFYAYRRLRLRRALGVPNPQAGTIVFLLHFSAPDARIRSLDARFTPQVAIHENPAPSEHGFHEYEISFDMSSVAPGEIVDLPIELATSEIHSSISTLFTYRMSFDAPEQLVNVWILLPNAHKIADFTLFRQHADGLAGIESVAPIHKMLAPELGLLSFSLVSVDPQYVYVCQWSLKN
jgi:predicted acylesterase/phospholipase RssA